MTESNTAAIQVAPEHYAGTDYNTRERFASYWHQIDEVAKRSPSNVLEVGIGNGFVHEQLRRHGLKVHTVDFDAALGPDTVGDVCALPFEDGAFEMSACFETLEHLPYERFPEALAELTRVSRRWVLISLPDVSPCLRWTFGGKKVEPRSRVIFDLPSLWTKPQRLMPQLLASRRGRLASSSMFFSRAMIRM